MCSSDLGSASGDLVRFTGLTQWNGFERSTNAAGRIVLTAPALDAGFPAHELILSWNTTPSAALRLEARCLPAAGPGPWVIFADWSLDTRRAPRTSIRGQKGTGYELQTDTLILEAPTRRWQTRITFVPGSTESDLRFLGLSWLQRCSNPMSNPAAMAPPSGRLDVPIRSQADYPEGVTKWCSPVAASMLMAWWSGSRGRPELDVPVPEVARLVLDPGWPGTGNWAFNVAWMGSFPGVRAFVTRLTQLAELELLVGHGFPVAASVSYAILQGRPQSQPGDGHLIVVTGFTPEGDVMANDPGVRLERVRRVFSRAAFEAAWRHSRNAIYLVQIGRAHV